MFSDLAVISPLSGLILIASIILFLRTFVSAALPIVTSGLSILWTFGFMGYFGIPLTLLTAIVPSLVIVIGSTEDTHLLSSYLGGLDPSKKQFRMMAIRFMAKHTGLPIFITGFTTTVGFLSNGISDIPLIQDFAYASGFAMFANLIVTILALPLIFILNLIIAINYGFSNFENTYVILFFLQVLFYVLALSGWYLENKKIRLKALFIPYYFFIMNYAMYLGFARYIKGQQTVNWERAKRGT
jgi:predicted RND superfamily exporter protein